MDYTQHVNARQTPQSQPIPGTVPNSAGGHSFPLDDWGRLDRFLFLGSEGGTYYIGEQQLTVENARAVARCIKLDGKRVVDRVVEVSLGGLAARNDPALFVLAMCAAAQDVAVRTYALDSLSRVARIGTHLFHFCQFVKAFRGWGPSLRKALQDWYLGKSEERLALQVIKYRQRDGWTHRDVLRVAHPKTRGEESNALLRWAAGHEVDLAPFPRLALVQAHVQAQEATSAEQIAALILQHNLPRESVPTQFLNDRKVWQALSVDMPMHAMVRNLGKMTSLGMLDPGSEWSRDFVATLTDVARIRASRLHPFQVLLALKTYSSGQGFRGKLSWQPNPQIVDALDRAFYLSFGNVEPTGKRIMLAMDISSSMDWGKILNTDVTPRVGAAAMALITAAVEPHHVFTGFTSGGNSPGDGISFLNISPRQRLDDVCSYMADMPHGGTDCSLPMLYALDRGMEVDAFVVYTDNETWAGRIHPSQALQRYREKMGIAAKLVVVSMTANKFSIADPNDAGMLDVVGFDASAPQMISNFIAS